MIDAANLAQSISLLGFLLYTWNIERTRANDERARADKAQAELVRLLELYMPSPTNTPTE